MLPVSVALQQFAAAFTEVEGARGSDAVMLSAGFAMVQANVVART